MFGPATGGEISQSAGEHRSAKTKLQNIQSMIGSVMASLDTSVSDTVTQPITERSTELIGIISERGPSGYKWRVDACVDGVDVRWVLLGLRRKLSRLRCLSTPPCLHCLRSTC